MEIVNFIDYSVMVRAGENINKEQNRIFFYLLRSAVYGTLLSGSEKAQFSDEQMPDMIKTAKKHDVVHLLAYGIKKNGLISKGYTAIEKSVLKAIYRYEKLNSEYENICELFETEGIVFMPLKGSVLRKYYPEEWMRTSCDIDILISENDIEKAADL